MLQLEHVCKSYITSSFTQVALDDVSLAFRDNEFVSILGPSGSGKTTMLNVIGGLDHFDSGDLVIDGISTREYKDRDWDAYRNNRIGFVFQSYNLIPHQTILANVELALTLSGVSAAERRERARQALAEVGLGDHVDKRPSQLSGGQMQRVAIARALINDPEILLADEPTGALDSRTSVQVMDLLREVADDRLVIMVTHNPELAREYSTRIVELADGRIRADSDPFVPTPEDLRDAKPPRRTSMSFLTALALSFNNLMTKKGRTLMTAFAGSIGIIGIAAILALANGVNAYIHEVEEETLSVYPLQITSSGFDMTSMIADVQGQRDELKSEEAQDPNTVIESRMVGTMFGSVGKNDLVSLKEYLDEDGGGIAGHVQDIEYLYSVTPQVFLHSEGKKPVQVNPDTTFESLGFGGSSMMSGSFSTNVFSQMPADLSLVEDQFDVRRGRWPEAYDELVLVLSPQGTISDFMSYAMGLRDHKELEEMVQSFAKGENVESPDDELSFSLEDLMSTTFKVVPAFRFYEHDAEYDVWTKKGDDEGFVEGLMKEAPTLKVVGVVQRREDVDAATISMGIYYTPQLTSWLMEQAAQSQIVKEQRAHQDKNILSGKSFDEEAQGGKDLDFSSLFSVDEDQIAKAFKFDESALDLSSLDLSGLEGAFDPSMMANGLDLSSIDFSADDLQGLDMSQLDLASSLPSLEEFGDLGLDLSSLDLSGIDLSRLDFSGVDLSPLLSPELLSALAPNISAIDINALITDIAPMIDEDALAKAGAALQTGFVDYVAKNALGSDDAQELTNALANYLASDEARQALQGVLGSVSISDADRALIEARLREQLANAVAPNALDSLDPQTRAKLDAQIGAVVDQVAQEVMSQVGRQLEEQMRQRLSQIDLSAIDPATLAPGIADGEEADIQEVQIPPELRQALVPDLSAIDLSAIDLSGVDLSGIDLGALLSPEVMAALAPNVSAIDAAKLFEGVTPRVDQAALSTAVASLQSGFSQYLSYALGKTSSVGDVSQLVQGYLATAQAQRALQELGQAVSISEEDLQVLAKRLQGQVSAPSASGIWDSLDEGTRKKLGEAAQQTLGQLAGQIANQVGGQLGGQLAQQLGARVGQVLSSSLARTMETYFAQVMQAYLTKVMTALQDSLVNSLGSAMQSGMEEAMRRAMESMGENMANAISIDKDAFAGAFDLSMSEKQLGELLQALMSTERATYGGNLAKMGYANPSAPSEIDIYPRDFESKAEVISILDAYNERAVAQGEEDKKITYTDLVGALMTSVTDIINMISYVLIAFVAISLVVSSIMIGVITYISVLERRKEIGILRSIGASKGDVSRVFNAETVIEGLVSGLMGVTITALACIPANAIVEANFDVERVARLPVAAAAILVGVSVLLSFVAGLLPARKAAKADPVEALRSE